MHNMFTCACTICSLVRAQYVVRLCYILQPCPTDVPLGLRGFICAAMTCSRAFFSRHTLCIFLLLSLFLLLALCVCMCAQVSCSSAVLSYFSPLCFFLSLSVSIAKCFYLYQKCRMNSNKIGFVTEKNG